jgi:hypothetical protein
VLTIHRDPNSASAAVLIDLENGVHLQIRKLSLRKIHEEMGDVMSLEDDGKITDAMNQKALTVRPLGSLLCSR